MLNIFSVVLKIFFVFLIISCSQLPIENKELVYWNTKQSEDIFSRAIKQDFFLLSNHFESQSNKIYCGPTTATIVLNALRLHKDGRDSLPVDSTVLLKDEKKYLPKDFVPAFKKYTQRNIFNEMTEGIKSKLSVLGRPGPDGKRDFGFQIRQYADFLKAHGLGVEMYIVNEKLDRENAKAKIVKNLNELGNFVIVNYKRAGLGQEGGGHISPLGAYDKESDRFLLMDVNTDKYTWVWVTSKQLFHAMGTMDKNENRGFLLVHD